MSLTGEHRDTPSAHTRAGAGHRRQPRLAASSSLGTRVAALGALLVLAVGGSTAAAGVDPLPPVAPLEAEPVRKTKALRPKPEPAWRMPAFWQRLAECETGGRWDWGRYAHSPARRHLEGTSFEGGFGFAATTWQLWAKAVHVLDRYPHAWMAPPRVQVEVAAYGLERGGSWGCLPYAYG